jgi:uncharacterized protein YceK
MKRGAGLVLMVTLAVLPTGCGTVANTCYFWPGEGGKRVYGGVRAEWETMQQDLYKPDPLEDGINRWARLGLFTVDLPLSAVGDTLTLPLTVPFSFYWALHSETLHRPATPAVPQESSPPVVSLDH